MENESPLSSPSRGWHSRGYLPHFERSVAIQSVTYRLADALPKEVIERFRQELEGHENDDQELRQRIEAWQDAGHGSCSLRASAHAKIVIAAWQHFDSSRYHLHAWVVMPNHVHGILEILRDETVDVGGNDNRNCIVETQQCCVSTAYNR